MDNKKGSKLETEFFDDEFGVYYDGEFYEEIDDEPAASDALSSDGNEVLLKEIERLRAEIKNIGSRQESVSAAAAPAPAFRAAANQGPLDGYQLRQEYDALRAYIKRSDIPLPLKIQRMLEFNRIISRIPYGEYDDIASAFELSKSVFLKTEINAREAEEIICFKDYGYDIVTEDDENNIRSFLLYKELYNPDDELNYHEIAARLLESKNKLQENCCAAANEQLYTGILNCNAELVIGGNRTKAAVKADIAALFKELMAITIGDAVNFPEVIRPGIKSAYTAPVVAPAPAPAPVQAAPAPAPVAAPAPAPAQAAQTPAPPQPKQAKPVTPPKAHYLARIIANRMVLDNILGELDEKELTRAQRDKIIKKLLPGASRLDDQPKDLVKIANTLVTDKLEAMNRQYEKMLKQRDREIKQAAREQAARERAEKAAERAASAEVKKQEKAKKEAAAAAAAADAFSKL